MSSERLVVALSLQGETGFQDSLLQWSRGADVISGSDGSSTYFPDKAMLGGKKKGAFSTVSKP